MSSELEILIQLKTQLVSFIDELIETFPSEPDFVIFRIFINDQIPIVDIMEYIVSRLCPLQDMVKNRDESFFLNYNILFDKFDNKKNSEKVNHFKRLWLSKNIDKEDKEVLWQWFASFIMLGNKYKEIKKTV
jgi:hypothetical protein